VEISDNELKTVIAVCVVIMFVASVFSGVDGLIRSGLLFILGGLAGVAYNYGKGRK